MLTEVPRLLDETAGVLCRALESLLPGLNHDWWDRYVVGKLSFQQRQHVERRRITKLDQLDLAALLDMSMQAFVSDVVARAVADVVMPKMKGSKHRD